jgi:hypothetical protein
MAEMGRYCKAYPIIRFREFRGWTEKSENARKEKQKVAGREVDEPRQLTDDSFLYLQENYVVTDGIAKDENIIYDDITPEWKEFCIEQLKFVVPAYEFQNDEM